MIRVAEYLLVRFQNRVGIPKWRILVTAWCLDAVVDVARSLIYQSWIVPRLAISLFVITVWCLIGPIMKDEQRRADRTLLIVPNENKGLWLWTVLRWATVFSLCVDVVPPIRSIDVFKDCIAMIAVTLVACDTFPMLGPTLKERLRNLITFRRTATLEQN